MPYLSTPIGDLRPEYDVVVVGSGYGGAIAALRMTQRSPSPSVCVLERGLERQAGEFPSTIRAALGELQVAGRMGRVGRRSALFDMRINRDISVLVGCGLGGTSLINAGVMLEPLPEVLNSRCWPESLRKPGALGAEFKTVKEVLGVGPVPDDVALPKVSQLFGAGQSSDPKSQGSRPPIAVSFVSNVDAINVRHRRCVLCGDCFAGCNHAAKNTVDRNYLAQARHAAIFCGIDARTIEPCGDEWRLHVRIVDRAWQRFGEPELTIRAGAIFLAAGTLGSTEILLRSRSRHTLAMSPRLGERFSGNGDAIAFGYNSIERVDGIGYGRIVPDDAAVGPTIAGMLDERRLASRAMIQEGALPGLLSPLLRVAAPIIARVTRVPADMAFDLSFRHLGRELHSLVRGVHHGALARTQTFLCMSIDDGRGKLGLVRDRIRVAWENAGKQAPFRRISARLAAITRARGGRYVINPFWSRLFGRRLITVHPLGGCALADDARCGVVNADGRVFNGASGQATYSNLYVCDGSIIPTPLGTNPALTISALAERIATAAPAPRTAFTAPAPRHIDPAVPGIRYAERLRGWLELDGKASRLELVLHISAENVEALLTSRAHEACIIGVARTPELRIQRWTISSGTLNVLIEDPRQLDTALLVYQLRLAAPSGESFWLLGHKTLNLATCRKGTWQAITRFRVVAYGCKARSSSAGGPRKRSRAIQLESRWRLSRLCNWVESGIALGIGGRGARRGRLRGRGEVRGSVLDTLRLASSVEVTYERRFARRLSIMLRYMHFFADGVIQARVWLLRRSVRAQPFHRPTLTLPADITTTRVTDSHVEGPRFLLTRCKRGDQPQDPVILAPGFGMAADAFFVGRPSLVEFLCDQGYEVWLLDYRGSDHLAISLTQFTLDELVGDFREAIAAVSQRAGGKVRIIAHCVASLVTTMMLLKEPSAGSLVKSAILSQTHVFQDHPLINRIKAWMHLSQLLRIAGFRPVLTSDHDMRSGRGSRLLDRLLRLYPTVEHCSSPVCRRTLLMYGEVIHHEQIDRATHDMLYDLFDRSNLTMLEHMSLLVRRGHAVDKHGREVYLLEKNGRHLTMPITLIQGRLNRLFRPIAAQRTHEWMLEHGYRSNRLENDARFTLTYFDDYAHLDHFLGKNAATEVFPKLADALRRMETVAD